MLLETRIAIHRLCVSKLSDFCAIFASLKKPFSIVCFFDFCTSKQLIDKTITSNTQ